MTKVPSLAAEDDGPKHYVLKAETGTFRLKGGRGTTLYVSANSAGHSLDYKNAFTPDQIEILKNVADAKIDRKLTRGNKGPPKYGEFLLCCFVPMSKHQERLGDFEEMFNTVWNPRFGRMASLIYLAQALATASRTACYILAAALTKAVIGFLLRR